MSERNQAAIEVITKYGSWLAFVAMGIVGKLGWDILSNRKISWRYVFGTGLCAVFVGWLASAWCMSHTPTAGPYVVPIATLISRDIMLFITMIDWAGVLKILTGKNVKQK